MLLVVNNWKLVKLREMQKNFRQHHAKRKTD